MADASVSFCGAGKYYDVAGSEHGRDLMSCGFSEP